MNKTKNLFSGVIFTLLILVSITAISAADTNTTGTQTDVQDITTQTMEHAEKVASAHEVTTKTPEKKDNKIKTINTKKNKKETTKNTTTNTKTVKTTTKSLKQETAGTFTQLQQAINNVENNELKLNCNYTRGTAETTRITIKQKITINGNGYTINANGGNGIFNITSGNVILANMTITGNKGQSAIIIETNANVTEDNITAVNNSAENGSVNYIHLSNLTIQNGNYSDNKASQGGVNYNDLGILTIRNGTFTNNTGNGGGVNYNTQSGKLTIEDGNFINNTATDKGGINYNDHGSITIKNGNYTNNTATNRGGVNYNLALLDIINGTFTGNNVKDQTINGLGGVNCNEKGTLTITNGNFTDNNATYGGVNYNEQGTLTITNGNFTDNNATYGGVNYNYQGNLTITNGNFTDNHAYNNGGVNYNKKGNLTINNGTYTNNRIIKTGEDYGGVNYNSGNLTINQGTYTNNSAPYGGVNYNSGNLTITNGSFTNNFIIGSQSSTGAGAVNYNSGTLTIINGTFKNNAGQSKGGVNYNNGDLTIEDGIYENNTIEYGSVNFNEGNMKIINGLFKNNTGAQGGVTYIRPDSTLTIINGTFTNNNATTGGVNYNVGKLTIENGTFTNNNANKQGGVNYNNGNLIINNGTFTNNNATNGSVNCNLKNLTITNGNYTNNNATNGGVNYNTQGGNLTITNGTFTNNNATNGGVNYNTRVIYGGKWCYGNLTIENGIFTNNNATENGGIIYNDESCILTVHNGTFSDNNAGTGSVLYNNQAVATISKGNFTHNYGYVLFTDKGTFTVVNNSFINNSCNNQLFNEDMSPATLWISDNTYIGNNLTSTMTLTSEISDIITKKDPIEITLTIKPNDIYNTTINIGNITIYENNDETQTEAIKNNQTTLTYNPRTGNYNLTIAHTDDTNSYTPDNITKQVKLSTETQTEITIVNETYGNTTIKVKIIDTDTEQAIPNAKITVTYDTEELHNTTDSNGEKTITLDLPVGSKTVKVTYQGDDTYDTSYDQKTINVKQRESNINTTVINSTITKTTINVTVTDKTTGEPVTGGNVRVTLSDTEIGTGTISGSDGTVQIKLNINQLGKQNIMVYYDETNTHYGNSQLIEINVIKIATTTTIKEINKSKVGEKITITGTVTDEEENSIIGVVKIKINNEEIENIEIKKGTYSYDYIPQKEGQYNITVTYEGDNTYNTSNNTTQTTATKIKTTTTIETTANTKIGDNITIKITLTDENKDVLKNQNIILSINGKEEPLQTKDDGTVTYKYETKTAGVLIITATYNGNDIYSHSDTTQEVNVYKIPTVITLENITTRINDTTNITVNVKDKMNNITGGRIILKVNGKTLRDSAGNILSAKIENGSATITTSFNQKPGLYQITVIYSGNSWYTPSRNADTILAVTPRDAQVTIKDMPSTITTKNEVSLKIEVTDNSTPVNTGRIMIKINGKTLRDSNGNIIYTAVTDGTADVKFTLPDTFRTKTYTLTAVYGDKLYNRAENTTQTIITNPLKTTDTNTTYTIKDNTPKTAKI